MEWSPSESHAAFLLLVIGLTAALLLSRRVAISPTARSWTLVVLRVCVLAILVMILANPVRISESRTPPLLPSAVYLVDSSRSMALEKPTSRLEQARQFIAR